ncbi:MAG: hypothetical protein ABEJ65_05110 [bacterium]
METIRGWVVSHPYLSVSIGFVVGAVTFSAVVLTYRYLNEMGLRSAPKAHKRAKRGTIDNFSCQYYKGLSIRAPGEVNKGSFQYKIYRKRKKEHRIARMSCKSVQTLQGIRVNIATSPSFEDGPLASVVVRSDTMLKNDSLNKIASILQKVEPDLKRGSFRVLKKDGTVLLENNPSPNRGE